MKHERGKKARAFYRKLLNLYPQAFRERVGESMEQTFDDLCRERAEAGKGILGFVVWASIETSVGIVREHWEGEDMKRTLASPRARAALGLLLSLPGALLLTLMLLEIEPNLGPLQSLVAAPAHGPNILGSLLALSALVFLPIFALGLNMAPIRRSLRTGGGPLAHPANLSLVLIVLVMILTVAGVLIADQFPCWIGVENCD